MTVMQDGQNMQNGQNNQNQVSEKERADANNANNIKNAADIAMASKNPYAMAAGGAVKLADKAKGGKSTEALGKATTKLMRRTPGGRRLQSASNKLSESGVSDKAGKAASAIGASKGASGKPGNGNAATPPASDVGEEKLKQAKANSSNHFWNGFRKKRNSKSKNSGATPTDTTSTESSSETSSESAVGGEENDIFGKALSKIKIKIVISLIIMMGCAILIPAIILSIFGIHISLSLPAYAETTYGTEDFVSTYEEGTEEYEQQTAYYEKLKEVAAEYKEENGEELETSYIHSVLIYVYYIFNPDEEEPTINMEEQLSEGINIDYKEMTEKIDTVVKLMKKSSDSDTENDEKKSIDYSIDGEFYNNLKNSSFFKSYYKKHLKNMDADSILEGIFVLAQELVTVKESNQQNNNN